MAEIMSEKPSYLGLLNGISLAETRGHCWLNAWIEKTPNPEVRKVLQMITAREGEHGMAFAKRINELGFELEQKDFDTVFSDHSIDIRTGELLGRYIAEEHDTGRLFKSCYQQLKSAATAAVEQLQETISAQDEPATNGKNGKSRSKTAAH